MIRHLPHIAPDAFMLEMADMPEDCPPLKVGGEFIGMQDDGKRMVWKIEELYPDNPTKARLRLIPDGN